MRTRSSNLAEDTALSFAKQMDDYITNSAVFKEAILKAFNVAVNEIIKPINEEIASLQCQVKMLKSKLTEVTTKANDNEQYSRRNNIRIFGLAETEGEDCYDVVLKLCQNDLDINVTRDELDRAHRVGKPKKPRDSWFTWCIKSTMPSNAVKKLEWFILILAKPSTECGIRVSF